jgi:hypothetical protein
MRRQRFNKAMVRSTEAPETSAVGRQPAPRIVLTLDFVHCLIGEQLLQKGRWRLPVDPVQHEKAAIEPGGKEMLEIGIEQFQRRLTAG